MQPSTGYAHLGSDRIYYQVLGEGPIDVVVNSGAWGSIDVEWDDPGIRLFYQKMAGLGRVILLHGWNVCREQAPITDDEIRRGMGGSG